MSLFQVIAPENFDQSPFRLIAKDWMLITAQNGSKANAMTASWGGMGEMWGKNVVFVVIRQTRYTKEFVDNSLYFSLTFFDMQKEGIREMLTYMGSKSGRQEDKIKKSKLTLLEDDGIPYFAEAQTAILCQKLYAQPFDGSYFIDPELDKRWYNDDTYHTLYIAEIKKILSK